MHPIVKLESFSKTYYTGEVEVHAVRGVSLDLMAGEFVAIMGASGSGKSTMINTRPSIPAREQRERAIRALEMVGLADRADHNPNQLSGGQQQRVAIARALVNQPKLLLADEPTGNLDTHTSIEIMGVFQELNRNGMTVVMVTHELDIARYTQRMVVMRDGRIVKDEPVRDRLDGVRELHKLEEEQKAVQLTA